MITLLICCRDGLPLCVGCVTRAIRLPGAPVALCVHENVGYAARVRGCIQNEDRGTSCEALLQVRNGRGAVLIHDWAEGWVLVGRAPGIAWPVDDGV